MTRDDGTTFRSSESPDGEDFQLGGYPQGFEHSPITSLATPQRTSRRSGFALAQAFAPHFPRSAGQEGFEHSPITSTVLSE